MKCCSYVFSLFHHWRCQLLTSTAASLYMLSKHLWIHFGYSPSAAKNSSNANCFKFPSISAIFKSTVYLPPVKLNVGDYQTMMRVQGLQLCSSYPHLEYTYKWEAFLSHCPHILKYVNNLLLDLLLTLAMYWTLTGTYGTHICQDQQLLPWHCIHGTVHVPGCG